MEYLITFLAASIGGLGGVSLGFLFFYPKPGVQAPASHVVKKLGPSLYTVEQKRKPKRRSESDEWKREQGQNL